MWLRYHTKFNGLIVCIPVIPVCETCNRWTLSLLVACNIWDLWDLCHCCWQSHRLRLVSSHNLSFNHMHQIVCSTQPAVSKQEQTHSMHAYCSPLRHPAGMCLSAWHETTEGASSVKVKGQPQLCDLEVINTTLQSKQALICWFAIQKIIRHPL